MLELLIVLVMAAVLGLCLASALRRVVRVRQALVVCDHATGKVRHLIVGPAVTPVLPLLEDVRVVDLSLQLTSLGAANVVTQDGLLVSAEMDVTWSIDPDLLRHSDLDQILPFLDDLTGPLLRLANYVLSSVLGRYRMSAILQAGGAQTGLERVVYHRLQDHLATLGARVHTVRLICQPEATMLNARIAAEARAQELTALAAILGPQNQIESLMRLEMLEAFHRSDPQLITAFEIPGSHVQDDGNGRGRLQFVVSPR